MNYEVTAPDGRKFVVTAPEGATHDQVLSYAKNQWDRRAKSEAIAASIANDTISTGARDFAKNMGTGEQVLAGAGSAVQNVVDAGKQLVGGGPGAEQVLERRRLDAPLMNTAGGLAGNVAGNLTMMAPASLLPGGATVPGAGAAGSILGALQPTVNAQERLQNMAVGGALGAGGQWLGTTGATMLGQRAAANQSAAQAAQMQNSVRDQTLRDAQAAGAKVPVSAVNPSIANNALESIGGKAAIGQELAIQNQRNFVDPLARQAGGLAPNEPLTAANLRTARQAMAQPYRDVSALSPQAAADLEALQAARFESKTQWKYYNRSADPAALQAAQAADANAQRLQQSLEAQAHAAGQPDLVNRLREARSQIAQNRQVQNALNRGTGSVDASVIGRALDNGAPLSGPLLNIGRFQQAFPQYAREAAGVPPPGVSKVAALASGGFGLGGIAAGGLPGAALASVPFVAPPIARSIATSNAYQRMARPSYSAGPVAGAANMGLLPTPEMVGLLGRTAIPSIYAGALQ